MTGFEDVLIALVFAFLLNSFVLYRITHAFPWDEARFLGRVYMATLLLRYALAVFLNVYSQDSSFASTFWGDSSTYDRGGAALAGAWSGDVAYALEADQPSGYGFFYVVAFFYYLFGRNQLLVQFVNGTIGALTAIVIYVIARKLFDKDVASYAARFMAFFPQMIFWSGALYKDPAIMLCIAVCMYGLLGLRDRFSPRDLLFFVAAGLAILTLRFYVFYFVAFATLGSFVFAQRRGLLGSLVAQVGLVAVFVAAFSIVAKQETLQQHSEFFELRRVQVSRLDLARSAGSGFAAEFDVSTPEGALAAIPVGFVYLMFAPFPWAITGLRQALTLPETLVWYSLMPALVRGVAFTVRHRFRAALPIFAFAISLTLAYSVFQGNVGTAYRQRTQITMFFFIFMGVGIVEKRRRRERLRAAAQAHPLHA
jgi:4-amino-4-deoxy-L-arabinose transferase-like glycosyltransferase